MILPWFFILDLGLWGMAVAVVCWAWPKTGIIWRVSSCSTAVLVMIFQSFNEILSRQVFQAWTFSYEHNRMIGVDFLGEPIEEYLFWWAFAWLIPFFYVGLVGWFNKWDARRGLPAPVSVDE